MITTFIIIYNIIRVNKSKLCWLNLYNSEGVTFSLVGIIADIALLIMYLSII
jgi:hypothetical protein